MHSLGGQPATLAKPVRGLCAGYWHVKFLQDPVACLCALYRRFGALCVGGSMVSFRRRERWNVLALGPEYNRQVLGEPTLFHTTAQTMSSPPDSALNRIRYGLTAMNGEKHRRQRQLVLPLFLKQAVEKYCTDMIAVVGRLIEQWPVGQTVDMARQMRRLTLRVSARVLFSREDPDRLEALGTMIRQLLRRSFSPRVQLFPVNWPGLAYRGLLARAERIEGALVSIIQERRGKPGQPADLLDFLIKASDGESGRMTNTDLLGQFLVLFTGSFENSASALTWTLFLLAQHPNVMSDLYDELHHVWRGSFPTFHQLNDSPLLDAVIKESMRLLPSVPFTIRIANGPAYLGGLLLRQGDRVVCSPYITHHLPDLFPEPEKFHPQRWFESKPGPYEYLPFGAGPRLCIGSAFAMTEIKITLAMILQKWRLTVVPGSRIDRTVKVTMGPRHGLPMTIHKQDRCFQKVRVHGDIHEMVDLTQAAA